MSKSKIEWTDETWNPAVGCSRVSKGCEHCYAEVMANRLQAMGVNGYEGVIKNNRWTGKINLLHEKLNEPFKWKRPRKIFVNSMSDLFHENVPFWFIDDVFDVTLRTPQHIYQILTKRPERMAEYFNSTGNRMEYLAKNKNIWPGISAEDQPTFDKRIIQLLKIPAAVRWLSLEPLLSDIEIKAGFGYYIDEFGNWREGRGISWVVVGGESGNKARPLHPDWVRSLRDQCMSAGTPFLFKQWGNWLHVDQFTIPQESAYEWTEFPDNEEFVRTGKKFAGRLLDGKIWDEYPTPINDSEQKPVNIL